MMNKIYYHKEYYEILNIIILNKIKKEESTMKEISKKIKTITYPEVTTRINNLTNYGILKKIKIGRSMGVSVTDKGLKYLKTFKAMNELYEENKK